MNSGIKRLASIIVLLMLAALLALPAAHGQENGNGDGSDDEKVVFTLGDDNDLDSMNPFVGVEAPAYLMYALNYDLLVNFSTDDLSPAPGLAESWETSEDGLTWTFKIREGVEWHDGEPFTSQDVKYTYERVLEERIGSYIDYLSLIDTIEAPDDTTLVIKTKKPTTQLLTAYVYIVPEHIWSKIDAKERKTFENYPNPIGTGAFQVVEWQKGQFFRMEANEDYWAGDPQIDEFVYRIFNNEDALVQALKAGEIDFADTLGANLFDSLENSPGIATNEASIPSFEEIGFNVGADETIKDSDGHPALKDVEVRRAMAMAIDKEVLVDRIVRGHATVGSTIIPPSIPFYHYEPTEDEVLAFDPEAANQVLDDAGYEDTDNDGIREMPGGGEPLRFRYFVRSEENSTRNASEFISEWLRDIGIETEVQALTDSKLTDVIYNGKYDMFHWGWFPDPDPDFILSIMSCGQRPPAGIWSDSFYCNEEYDRMYQEQKTLLDLDERAEVIKEMQRMVYEDAPYIVLYYDKNLQAYSDDWEGFVQQPEGVGDLLAAYGPISYISIRPASAESGSTDDSEGISPVVWIAIIGGIVLVAVVAMVVRRRVGDEDRA